MLSPVIPLEALLELRRFLDSIQAAETRCERPPVVQEAAEATPRPASRIEAADNSRKQKNRKTSFKFFNNIPR
jgi:hypothetical protein